jgi:hypothetical protein
MKIANEEIKTIKGCFHYVFYVNKNFWHNFDMCFEYLGLSCNMFCLQIVGHAQQKHILNGTVPKFSGIRLVTGFV